MGDRSIRHWSTFYALFIACLVLYLVSLSFEIGVLLQPSTHMSR